MAIFFISFLFSFLFYFSRESEKIQKTFQIIILPRQPHILYLEGGFHTDSTKKRNKNLLCKFKIFFFYVGIRERKRYILLDVVKMRVKIVLPSFRKSSTQYIHVNMGEAPPPQSLNLNNSCFSSTGYG